MKTASATFESGFFLKGLIGVFVLLSMISGCTRDDRFLENVPQAPPPPFRYERYYKMDVNTSMSYATDVDILWVIDNSGSMGVYQQQVIDNSAEFIREFTKNTKLNWRLGLISTDERDEPYLGFDSVVDWQLADPVSEFNAAVAKLGVGGDSDEKTCKPVESVLKKYPDFLRPGAYFILIVVSDEPEHSTIDLDQFIGDQIRRVDGDTNRFAVFGVYSPGSNDYSNDRYKQMVEKTNGKIYDLSAPDYGVLLSQMGQDLVVRTASVNPVIMLDQIPKPGTIVVKYKGRVLKPGIRSLGGDWTYDSRYNVIHINNPSIVDRRALNVIVSFELGEKTEP